MSDNEEMPGNYVPDASTASALVSQFAEITGTDVACGQFYLQDRNWDLQRSLDAYFRAKQTSGLQILDDGDEPQVVFNINKDIVKFLESATTTRPPSEFRLLSWNLDGLDDRNLKIRTKGVTKILKESSPDIVFFQEIVPKTLDYIQKNIPPQYKFIAAGSEGYFTVTLINEFTVKYDSHEVIEYPQSLMSRNLLQVEAHIGKMKLVLLNTHLESTADHSKERLNQLQMCFKRMLDASDTKNIIMGGDLNLRDKELGGIGGPPSGIEDLWIVCGSRKECQYTWDTQRNSNKEIASTFKPRLRFDRLYLRPSRPRGVFPKYFGLIGLQKIAGHQCFPSDHWGLITDFDIDS